MAPFCKELEAKLLGLLDFSCIHGYLLELHYELWKKHAPRLSGNHCDSLPFVVAFMDFIEKFNLVHEDVIMKIFALSMKIDAREWYCNLFVFVNKRFILPPKFGNHTYARGLAIWSAKIGNQNQTQVQSKDIQDDSIFQN